MKEATKRRLAPLTALLIGAVVPLAGCESQGPAESAGKKIDQGIQKAKDTVNPPGPAEKVGRALDKAAGQ
jgi:hypothetical protein